MNNSGFFKRLLAFIIDMIIVSIISSIIYSGLNSIFNFKTTNTENYVKNVEAITNKFNEIDKDNTADMEETYNLISDFSNMTKDNYKDITIEGVPNSLVNFVVVVLYFIVLAFYLKGQTFGKKLLNIRIVNNDNKPVSVNALLVRGIILYSLYSTIVDLIFVFILDNDSYYKLHSVMSGISFTVMFISFVMIIFNKDKKGIHDLISKTKVVIDE